jgi:hypothetical protein
MFPNNVKIRWYRIIASTPANKNIEGPQTKFCENTNWQAKSNAIKIGADVVVGRGIRKSSLVISLSKSTRI